MCVTEAFGGDGTGGGGNLWAGGWSVGLEDHSMFLHYLLWVVRFSRPGSQHSPACLPCLYQIPPPLPNFLLWMRKARMANALWQESQRQACCINHYTTHDIPLPPPPLCTHWSPVSQTMCQKGYTVAILPFTSLLPLYFVYMCNGIFIFTIGEDNGCRLLDKVLEKQLYWYLTCCRWKNTV